MTPILSAMAQGYSAKHIIQYLQKNVPALKSPIAKAVTAGYSADKILEFLSNNSLDEARKQGATPNELQAMRRQGYNKNAARIAGAAASFIPVGAIARGLVGAGSAAGATQATQIAAAPPAGQLPHINTPATAQTPAGLQAGPGPQPMANAPVQPQQSTQGQLAQAAKAAPIPQAAPVVPPDQQGFATHPLAKYTQDPEFKAFAQAQIDKGNTAPLPEMVKLFEKEKKKSPFAKGIKEHLSKMANDDFITPAGDIGTIKSWLWLFTLITIIICACILKPTHEKEIVVKVEFPSYGTLKIDQTLHNR